MLRFAFRVTSSFKVVSIWWVLVPICKVMVLHTVEALLVGSMQDLRSKMVSGLDQAVRSKSDLNSNLCVHGVFLLSRGHLQLLFGANGIQSFELFGGGTTSVPRLWECSLCIYNLCVETIQ